MKEKKRWIQFLLLVFSAAVMAFDTNVFIRVGNLSPGGVSGLALLLQSACELFFHVKIPYSVFYLLFNAIPLYIGFRYLGRKFTLYSCFVIVLTSVFTDMMPSVFITDDLLLCALFGGLLCGFSIGLALIAGATSGGTDFISIYLSEKKGVDTWNIILCYNAVVSILTGFLHGWDKTLYSMNPELTMTLPEYQTQSGCVDIMMHTMERYFNRVENMELTDGISENLLRTVMKNARILMDDPENYDARAEVMWAGSLSHNGLTGCGTDGGDWACHQLEHELGATYDVTHGAGLAAVWGTWARYVWKEKPDRFLKFARNVMQVQEMESDEKTILAGIEAMEAFYRSIHMPVNLKELGISGLTEEEIQALAYRCTYQETRTIGCIKKLGRKEIADIYRLAQ